jgi:glutamate transport system substrate-binding protein
VADASAIAPGSWADKVRRRGTLEVGGTDAGPLFSLKDPTTGKVTGFDAGLSQMLAHYITGKPTNDPRLTITTVDTRETLIQNGAVDAVFATYTITPARAAKVAFVRRNVAGSGGAGTPTRGRLGRTAAAPSTLA